MAKEGEGPVMEEWGPYRDTPAVKDLVERSPLLGKPDPKLIAEGEMWDGQLRRVEWRIINADAVVLKPGDQLLLKLPADTPQAESQAFKDFMDVALPDNRIVILAGDMEIVHMPAKDSEDD
jgi:hypothetical protein